MRDHTRRGFDDSANAQQSTHEHGARHGEPREGEALDDGRAG